MKKVIQGRKDVAFYIKLFPIVQIHPEAYQKAKAIACEKSNEKALRMLEDAFAKKPLPEPSCETDLVDKTIELGKRLAIRGTPTIIFMDGSRISGAVSMDELIKNLEGKNPNPAE